LYEKIYIVKEKLPINLKPSKNFPLRGGRLFEVHWERSTFVGFFSNQGDQKYAGRGKT
jgi:hypothetical protein